MTFEAVIPQMIVLDVSAESDLGGKNFITRECVLFKVAWWRGPGAGIAGAEVASLAVCLHVVSIREALPTIRALVRA